MVLTPTSLYYTIYEKIHQNIIIHNEWKIYMEGICDIPRGVFVNVVHRKLENCGAKSCECMISLHRGAVTGHRGTSNIYF